MRKLISLLLGLLVVGNIYAQEATPESTEEAESALRLRPFTLEIGEISGVAPALWDELQAGAYIRDDGDIDNTYILQISAEAVPADELLDPFLAAYELDSLPESSESYDSALLTWAIYSFDFSPNELALRVDIGVAELENRVYVVLLQSLSAENIELLEQVFFPALDNFGLALADIYTSLGYTPLSSVELENFGIESAYPSDWQGVNTGSYMRGEADITTLIIQTSPDLAAIDFAQLLLETLGLPTELPSETESFETSLFTWTIYQINFTQGSELSLLIALAEDEQRSYMVVLLTNAAEAQSLHDSILIPVMDATKPLD